MNAIASNRPKLAVILVVALAIMISASSVESTPAVPVAPALFSNVVPPPRHTASKAIPYQVPGLPSGPVLWSCNFESGTMQGSGTSCFNVANPSSQNVCSNSNNPGVVESTNVYDGTYAGYYSSDGSASGNCRSYWNVVFGGGTPAMPAITTQHYIVDGWFYVPSSASQTSWSSFITLSWCNCGQPDLTVDTNPAAPSGRVLYIHDVELEAVGQSNYYRQATGSAITWPLDTWFNIALEVNLVPSTVGSSTINLYQNGQEIIHQVETIDPSYNPVPNLQHMHFGLYIGTYNGAYNAQYSVYNDDLALEDLSGAPVTSTSATSARSTTSSSNTHTSTSNSFSQTTTATSSATSPTTAVSGLPTGPVLWSCDFAGGTAQASSSTSGCFNVPNPSGQDVCTGSNNPGIVENYNVYPGSSYAGYYSSQGSSGGNCRSYWNVVFGGGTPAMPTITSQHYIIDGWFYVPSNASLSSWTSFITLSWCNCGQPDLTIDTNPAAPSGRVLYIHDVELTAVGQSNYYRQTNPITWPLDQWFNIGFELNLVPSTVGPSTYNVYQNGQLIIHATPTIDPSYSPVPDLQHMHFGLYMGTYNGAYNAWYGIYNANLVLEDLSGQTSTSTFSATTSVPITSTIRTSTSNSFSQTSSTATTPITSTSSTATTPITSTSSTATTPITSTTTQIVTSTSSSGTITSTQTSTQTLTQTSAATSAGPTVTPSPASATVGSSVSLAGSGFSASDTSCTLSGGAIGTSSCAISGGSLAASFVVANAAVGSYTITATGSPGGDSATFAFSVLSSGPSISLSSASASVGSTVTVSGSGFSTSDTSCSLSGGPVGTPHCAVSGGTLSGSFVVVNAGSGSYTITAIGDPASDSATATFTLLIPSITLSPSTANPGATVSVSGSGFNPSDTTCSFIGGGVGTQSCSISDGTLTGSFTVANAASGTYTISVVTSGGDSGEASASLQVTNSLATTTTATLLATSTATQLSDTTTTFTQTGIFTTESIRSVTVTVTGESTASVATASTVTSFVTSASTTTVTQTSFTTNNVITGMTAPSFVAGWSGGDVLGFVVALLTLVSMVLRKLLD